MNVLASVGFIVATAALLTLQACDRTPLKDVPVTKNVTFEQHIQPITSRVCIGCHSTGSRDYSQYKNAYMARYSIRQRVAVDRSMPMGVFLDDKDRALFRDWVDQGGNR